MKKQVSGVRCQVSGAKPRAPRSAKQPLICPTCGEPARHRGDTRHIRLSGCCGREACADHRIQHADWRERPLVGLDRFDVPGLTSKGKPGSFTVAGQRVGAHLAVTSVVYPGRGWTVTHLPTGRACAGRYATFAAAKRVATRLADIVGLDWRRKDQRYYADLKPEVRARVLAAVESEELIP